MRELRYVFALVTILSFYPGCLSSIYADTLASLVDSHGTIQQGDKLFSNFSFVPGNPNFGNSLPGSFGPADTGNIDIQGITDVGQNGLRFTGPFFENSTPLLQGFTFYQIEFDVTVTDLAFLIHDLHESFSGTSSGENVADIETSTIGKGGACNVPGKICAFGTGGVFSKDVSGLLPSDVSHSHVIELFSFSPVIGSGGDPTGFVNVPSIDVTFSQNPVVVPEPASVPLLLIGLVGLGTVRHRLRGARLL